MTSALKARGVPSKADIVSNLSKGGCVNLRTRGEGVKKSENFADVIYGSPLSGQICTVRYVAPYLDNKQDEPPAVLSTAIIAMTPSKYTHTRNVYYSVFNVFAIFLLNNTVFLFVFRTD